jgi:hypothetical protein
MATRPGLLRLRRANDHMRVPAAFAFAAPSSDGRGRGDGRISLAARLERVGDEA